MKKQVYKSFKAYIDLAAKEFESNENVKRSIARRKTVMTSRRGSIIKLAPKQIKGMDALLSTLEDSDEFFDLLSAMSVSFGCSPISKSSDVSTFREEDIPTYEEVKIRELAETYFRRSGLYMKVSQNEPVNCDAYFDQLWRALQKKTVKTTSLRLIEMVDFREDIIDLGEFKIQKFSKAELDELFENDLRSTFYRYAALDTTTLSQYWFIREETVEAQKKFGFERNSPELVFAHKFIWEDMYRIHVTAPDKTYQLLALFDWESFTDSDLGWVGFRVPFSLGTTDDILVGPSRSPSMTGLSTSPLGEAWNRPPINFKVGDAQRLKDVVCNADAFLKKVNLSGCHWEFIERAMEYLTKAFFSVELEQLLWHMIVLETLFGEDSKITESIARRLGNVLGETESKKKDIRKEFRKLYKLRSELVHGRKLTKQVMKKHLAEARSLSRKSLVWFLTYLSDMHSKLKRSEIQPSDYPRRNELLALLDHKKDGLGRLEILLKKSSTDFPDIKIWGER